MGSVSGGGNCNLKGNTDWQCPQTGGQWGNQILGVALLSPMVGQGVTGDAAEAKQILCTHMHCALSKLLPAELKGAIPCWFEVTAQANRGVNGKTGPWCTSANQLENNNAENFHNNPQKNVSKERYAL